MDFRLRASELRTALRPYGLATALVLIALVFNVLTDGLFLSSANVPTMLRQAAITAVAAMGVSRVIVMGHIDLSIGSAVGLCAIIVAYLMDVAKWEVAAAIVAVVGVGIVMGACQGAIVTVLGVPALVVTLAGLLVFQGIGLVITQGNTIATFPPSFRVIGQGSVPFELVLVCCLVALAAGLLGLALTGERLALRTLVVRSLPLLAVAAGVLLISRGTLGLPVPVLIMGVVAAVLGVVSARSRFGRHLYAIGGNRSAAELSGIRVDRNVLGMFAIMGFFYALIGMMFAARLDGAPPLGARFLELDAIAAAVIGGTSLQGGVGSVNGALLGALLLAAVANGLSLMNVPTYYQLIATGAILVVAVAFDVRTRRVRA
jgi:D-xylose transport system permease protein